MGFHLKYIKARPMNTITQIARLRGRLAKIDAAILENTNLRSENRMLKMKTTVLAAIIDVYESGTTGERFAKMPAR